MGVDWEQILGAESDSIGDAWQVAVDAAIEQEERHRWRDEEEPRPAPVPLPVRQAAGRAPSAPAGFRLVLWRGGIRLVQEAWSGRRFTDAEIFRMLAGEMVEVEALRRDGQRFSGRLRLQRHHGVRPWTERFLAVRERA